MRLDASTHTAALRTIRSRNFVFLRTYPRVPGVILVCLPLSDKVSVLALHLSLLLVLLVTSVRDGTEEEEVHHGLTEPLRFLRR